MHRREFLLSVTRLRAERIHREWARFLANHHSTVVTAGAAFPSNPGPAIRLEERLYEPCHTGLKPLAGLLL